MTPSADLARVRTRALLGAAAWGIAILLIVEVLSASFAFVLARPSPDALPMPGLSLGPLGAVSGLTALNCVVILLVDIGIGVLYTVLHRREGLLSANVAAGGGSAAVTLSHLVSGLFGLIITLVLGVAAARSNPGAPAAVDSVLANALRIIVLLLAGSVLGAIGGVLGVALGGRGRAASRPSG